MNKLTDTLLFAARIAESGGVTHPLDAISIAARTPEQYYAAARLFLRVCGTDNMDLSQAEMIDDLTAVAMGDWRGLL